jgi:hypothetical protein
MLIREFQILIETPSQIKRLEADIRNEERSRKKMSLLDPELRLRIQQDDAMTKALRKADGHHVRDDVAKLK